MNVVRDRKQKREAENQKVIANGNGDLRLKASIALAGSEPSENIFLFYPNIIGMSSGGAHVIAWYAWL